jgi:hypothetical protein
MRHEQLEVKIEIEKDRERKRRINVRKGKRNTETRGNPTDTRGYNSSAPSNESNWDRGENFVLADIKVT